MTVSVALFGSHFIAGSFLDMSKRRSRSTQQAWPSPLTLPRSAEEIASLLDVSFACSQSNIILSPLVPGWNGSSDCPLFLSYCQSRRGGGVSRKLGGGMKGHRSTRSLQFALPVGKRFLMSKWGNRPFLWAWH